MASTSFVGGHRGNLGVEPEDNPRKGGPENARSLRAFFFVLLCAAKSLAILVNDVGVTKSKEET